MENKIKMTAEEVRLRSLLAIRTGDIRYTFGIPREMEFYGLYPERMRPFKIKEDGKIEFGEDLDKDSLKILKEKLDKELGIK